ncbi:MAG TPA: tRNA guanosine(34) transglycosylase Tgt [Elusimicrobiota bacterium]|nr:tRNA guanosine(34) transglycosylase Tgt [Elusimicrobiota bacterium]HNG45512.1 tRNA guanosine(34) transglycosylase Tgt [Elusimicrobiota bacterium]
MTERAPGHFELETNDGAARAGRLTLAHATVETPIFMPVGTQATVKTLSADDLETLGYSFVLANTYHLWLRPGIDLLEKSGGLHAFMSWKGAILTDSGGFQVFSLANRRDVSEDGVSFSSHVDGARHRLTPETVVDAQLRMGVDVAMCLDECPPYPVAEADAREMMERTLRWTGRARERWAADDRRGKTLLFPIVQGATFPALRTESARRTAALDFPGYAVGGLSVGEPRALLGEMIGASVRELPAAKPRYLMGVGRPEDVLTAVERGIDMFDCVWPTRNARNGQVMTWDGSYNVRVAALREDGRPLEPSCACPVCRRYTRRYLAHLFRAGETTALRLLTLHNLAFMLDFLRQIRRAIVRREFTEFKHAFLERQSRADGPPAGISQGVL